MSDEQWSYAEIKEYLDEDYEDFTIKYNPKMTFDEATCFIIDEYHTLSDVERIMFYVYLQKKGDEHKTCNADVFENMEKIVNENLLEKYKDQFDPEDYAEVKKDYEALMEKHFRPGIFSKKKKYRL